MTSSKERPSRRKKVQEQSPSASDLFARPDAGEPQYADIFDPLFAAAPNPDGTPLHEPPAARYAQESWFSRNRLLNLQRILWAGVVCVALAFVYVAFQRNASESAAPDPAVQQASAAPSPQEAIGTQEPLAYEGSESSAPRAEPLSLGMAEALYFSGDFDGALATYDKLYRRLPATEQNQPVKDFLLLRMALCNKNGGNASQADSMFRAVALSRQPVLRAIARYCQSIALIDRQRYLEAATRAYQTIALVNVVEGEAEWSAAVQRQCQFLVAEALTCNVLSLQDADANLPDELWGRTPDIDPFGDLDEVRLKALLSAGQEVLDRASLTPQIHPVAAEGTAPRWSVTCNGASLEELLARVSNNAGVNVHWADTGQPTTDEETGRKRPVHLHLASATAQQIITTAAGSVGLLARMDEQGNARILDPSSYSSLAQHRQLLADESVSLWQRFLAGADDSQQVANAHFALALLQTARDQLDEAIAEYKLVANRFARHALAPHALLHSGRLKVRLRDYIGAHEDLKQLIDLYPDAKFSDQACLELAHATMRAGLYEEAAGLYRKVFNMGLSRESQIESALGAGRCFHEMQNQESAVQWLNRYIAMARDQNRLEFHSACLLLGKTYLALDNLPQAQAALTLALRGELPRQQHVETVVTLVRTYIQQGLFADALNVLEGTQAWQLSQQETIDVLLLRVQVLRSIGLTDKAIALLTEKGPFLPGPEFTGAVALELAACHAANGDLTQAMETLGAAFAAVEPGDLAQDIGARLAELCLRANQPARASSVCSQLLTYATNAQRQRLLRLQAEAYRRQKEYGRAVATLLSQHAPRAEPPAAPGAASDVQKQQ